MRTSQLPLYHYRSTASMGYNRVVLQKSQRSKSAVARDPAGSRSENALFLVTMRFPKSTAALYV